MGERKVLNKYYPPDFDPAKLPKGQRKSDNEMKVRMMLPMSVRCKTCGTFMYKGTKFNTRKEDVAGENYLGIQVYRFYWRCKKCAAEFTMKTDPKNADYVLEQGATRNYEPWREEDAVRAEAEVAREEEEKGNAMKALENRTLDSKREMDIMAALDEMRTLNAQHSKVTTEQAIAALQQAAATQHVDDDDAADIAEFYQLRKAAVMQRLDDDEDDDEDAGASVGPNATVSVAAAPGHAGPKSQPSSMSGLGAGGPGPGSSAPAATKPAVKVVVKPKQQQQPAIVAGASAGAKRPPATEAADGAAAKRQKEQAASDGEDGGEGLVGLLGQYGSSESDA